VRRTLVVGCVLLALGSPASSQQRRWQIKPETLPNWVQVELLSKELIASDPEVRERAEAELLAMGKPALHPLLIIGRRDLPQSAAVQQVWPKFGEAFIDEAIELEIASFAPCHVAAGMGTSLIPKFVKLIEVSNAARGFPGESFGFCVLGRLGKDAVPALIELVRNQQLDARKRSIAITALVDTRDERAAPVLLEHLDGTRGMVRSSAAGLARLKDPRVLPKLVEMAQDQSQIASYRELALRGLGGLYSKEFRDVIARAAWQDEDMTVRKAAANALIGRGDRVAERIGGRYFPIYRNHLFSYYEWGPRLAWGALFVCLAVWLAARHKWAVGLALGLIVGIFWGFFARDVWVRTETWLLAAYVPLALLGLLIFGCSNGAMGVVLAWALANTLAPLGMMLLPIMGPWAVAIPGWGPYAFPGIALLGLIHFRETDPGTLARDRAATGAIAATFYLSYAVSFAALWGHLGF
jgi:HEAT repeat protein